MTNFPSFSEDVFNENINPEGSNKNEDNQSAKIITKNEQIGIEENNNTPELIVPDFLENDFQDEPTDINNDSLSSEVTSSNKINNGIKRKKVPKNILILFTLGIFTALGIGLYFLLDFILNSNTKSSISTNVINYQDDINSQELDQEILSYEKEGNTNELSFTSNSGSDTNDLPNEQNIISEVSNTEPQSVNNFEVNVVDITGDEYIDTNLALLGNYDNKIKVNTLGEFSGYEENNNKDGGISTKQEQRTIESIPKVNFIPNINVKIHNLDNTFKVSDIITLKFDLILNSRSLKYSMTQKIYGDDFVINITPLDISSPLISIEENLVSEEIILPLDLMTKGKHKVGIKVNNLTKATYEFIVE